MGQKIRIECDDPINIKQLSGLQLIAWRFSEKDLRVNSDKTNIKVYVGDYYHEHFRFWIDDTGENNLVERDLSPKEDDADWQPSTMLEATLTLIPEGSRYVPPSQR